MAARGDQTKCALFPEPVWKSDLSRMQGRGGTFLRKSRRGRAEKLLDVFLYFCNYRNITKPIGFWSRARRPPRLEIVRLLLSAHPAGMVAGEVQEELEIPASTLSHHLEKLKQVGLVNVRRVGTFLW
jgi:DNA-binding transcriptional ArsR family regulator